MFHHVQHFCRSFCLCFFRTTSGPLPSVFACLYGPFLLSLETKGRPSLCLNFTHQTATLSINNIKVSVKSQCILLLAHISADLICVHTLVLIEAITAAYRSQRLRKDCLDSLKSPSSRHATFMHQILHTVIYDKLGFLVENCRLSVMLI